MLENFIYIKQKDLFIDLLEAGDVLDEAIVFIEDTKEIWNHGTYFDGNAINLKTINGKSILGEGDIVIEGGAKVYTLNWDGESESVTLSQEEYDNIVEADIVVLSVGGIYHVPVVILDFREEFGVYGLVGRLNFQGAEVIVSVLIDISTKLATVTLEQQDIPTKTSQLENDSDFVSSDGLKTINGESIVGSGDITVQTDLTGYATETYVNEAVSSKQGIIDDLNTIRSGAALGATALQSETYKGTITGVSANGTSIATSGVANIPAASTSKYGVTKLSSATNSTSTSLAATASAVKAAYDLAASKTSNTGTITGITMNGSSKGTSGVVDLGTVITEHQTLKTINGESIVGSGNIVIEGGSSSGAYVEVNHGTSDTTFTLTPNTFHVWDEVASLDLSFGAETSGVANEYLFQFTSGATATTLTLPSDIKWANDTAPTIAENMIYQISVLKGLASVLEFSNASSTIFFYIDGTEYQADRGSTWETWIGSEYNTDGWQQYEGMVIDANYQKLPSVDSTPVALNDEIIEGYNYETVS